MVGKFVLVSALLACVAATPSQAQDRSFCAERPGMGKPACTVGPGQVILEVTMFALDRAGPVDTQTYADTLMRFGLTADTELQLGLTGHVRTLVPDPARTGARLHASGIGDGYIAVRQSLTNAGPMAALEGYVMLPTGSSAVSTGTWGAGIVLPMILPAIGKMAVSFTPELAAVPNASGRGRHLTYGAVLGVSGEVAGNLGASLEIAGDREDAPEGGSFSSNLAGSIAWQATDDLQVNLEVDVGMIAPVPRALAMVGFALRL